jgi:hypothetical protein
MMCEILRGGESGRLEKVRTLKRLLMSLFEMIVVGWGEKFEEK